MVDSLIEGIKYMRNRNHTLNNVGKAHCEGAYDLLVNSWYLSGSISIDDVEKWDKFRSAVLKEG